MTLDTRVRRHIPPRSKKAHLFSILDTLMHVKPVERTDLAKSIETAAPLIRRKGLIVVFSDLLDDPEPVIKQLRHLRSRGQDLIVFQILDPAELRFPFKGSRILRDPETGMEIAADADSVRNAYNDKLRSLLKSYRRQLRSYGIDYLLMDTSTPFGRNIPR